MAQAQTPVRRARTDTRIALLAEALRQHDAWQAANPRLMLNPYHHKVMDAVDFDVLRALLARPVPDQAVATPTPSAKITP